LGHPEREYLTIHIGGTNGKGSVAVLVADALQAAGLRTALYTSPHLVDVRERMLVNGVPISRDAFATWTVELQSAVVESGASFFEATTAIAFADFAARRAEIAVVEVGLGGRLDATNVLTPLVAAVTNVSLEHQDYLGSDLVGIAREKAGIAKRGIPFVVGESDPDLLGVLEDAAARAGAVVVRLPSERRYEGRLALAGPHQARNAAVAEAVLGELPPEWRPGPSAVRSAFARARLPGRFDWRGKWIFDVAHNAAGMDAFATALEAAAPPRPVHALVGILADKDADAMLRRLGPLVDVVWLTNPPSAPPERVWDPAPVARGMPQTVVAPTFDEALAGVQQGARTVVVAGSFHTVGDAMARLPGFAPLR
jgi:dihydrofolate synthase/folylpolyglutamate synthase